MYFDYKTFWNIYFPLIRKFVFVVALFTPVRDGGREGEEEAGGGSGERRESKELLQRERVNKRKKTRGVAFSVDNNFSVPMRKR